MAGWLGREWPFINLISTELLFSNKSHRRPRCHQRPCWYEKVAISAGLYDSYYEQNSNRRQNLGESLINPERVDLKIRQIAIIHDIQIAVLKDLFNQGFGTVTLSLV